MKRVLCVFLLCVLFLGYSVPAGVAQIPAGMKGPTDTAQIAERILKLMEQYPSGSYFTKNGRSCGTHANGIANCIEVTAEQAGTPGNRQCFGFARMVFWHVFGKPFPHFNDDKSWLVTGDELENVTRIWVGEPGTRLDETAVRQAFSQAKIGDFVQCGIPHSMTFLQLEEEGILVYDANYEMSTCRVLVHLVGWDQLIKWIRRYGMSIYRAVEYPETVNHAPFAYTPFNGGNVSNLKIAAHPAEEPVLFHAPDLTGLMLIYTAGSKECTLTCIGGLTFRMTGAFGDTTVTAGSEDEYAPRITPVPGDGHLIGSVQIEFLNTAAILICPVEKREPALLSFQYPTVLSYRMGENFDPAGARMEIQDEDLNAREFKDGEITFTGLDISTPGQYTVTMEAYGVASPPFTITVIRGATPAVPGEEDPPVTGEVRILVAVLMIAAAAAVLIFTVRSARRSGR